MLRGMVTIYPVSAEKALDFRGWPWPAVGNYKGHPRNAGAWGSVWPGVGVVWSALQGDRQAPLLVCHTTPPPVRSRVRRDYALDFHVVSLLRGLLA